MKRVLPILWCFIGLVCGYDVYLSIEYSHDLPSMEWNPIGRWLMSLGGVAAFISVKFVCNLLMCLGLILLHRSHPARCAAATYAVALVQLALLAFLNW